MMIYDFPDDSLVESVGMPNRRAGEKFYNPASPDDIATFKTLTYLPDDGSLAYATSADLTNAIDKWLSGHDGAHYDINRMNNGMRSAMIVTMDTPRGTENYIYYSKDNGRPSGKITDIPAGVIPDHGGYKYRSRSAQGEALKLKPSDVITSTSPMTPSEIADSLDSAKNDPQTAVPATMMQDYLRALIAGTGNGYVIKGGAVYAAAFQNYLGEYGSPIALVTDQFSGQTSKRELEQALSGGENISEGGIIFNRSTSEKLIDSFVEGLTWKIGVSTKAQGKGAAASVAGLYDTLTKNAHLFTDGFMSQPKVQEFKSIVTALVEKNQRDGPLDLAVDRGIISAADAENIRNGLQPANRDKWKPTSAVQDLMNEWGAREAPGKYDPAKHALAAVAKELADDLNEEGFSDTMAQILNHASVVQMNFDSTVKGEDFICKGYMLIWPPSFDGTIVFDASKNYSSTNIKGKMCFKIGKGAALLPDPDESFRVNTPRMTIAQKALDARKKEKQMRTGEQPKSKPTTDGLPLGRRKKQ